MLAFLTRGFFAGYTDLERERVCLFAGDAVAFFGAAAEEACCFCGLVLPAAILAVGASFAFFKALVSFALSLSDALLSRLRSVCDFSTVLDELLFRRGFFEGVAVF